MRFEKRPEETVCSKEAPARPWGAPSPDEPQRPVRPAVGNKTRLFFSIAFAVLTVGLVGTRAYQDLSTPQAWAYWKDSYFSPSMTSSIVRIEDPSGSGQHPALAVSGKIGPAAAGWFRTKLDEAKLGAGDMIVFSSPGGDVDQAIIIGEIIRSRGLATAVGAFDAEGHMLPSYCASACVLAYAGGKVRLGVQGSLLGVHRFTTNTSERDLVADTQRTAGMILGYMTKMGVSPSVVEAMSATREIRWLDAKEVLGMRLVTHPLNKR